MTSPYYDPDGYPCDMWIWIACCENLERKIVEQTTIGDWWVSTVYLGLDHSFGPGGPPLTYETMLFDNATDSVGGGPHPHDGECWRYASREAAQAGHDQVVAWVRGGMRAEVPAFTRRAG